MIKVLYPGSFDPITFGHMNIIEQSADLFDEVIIAVMHNSKKTCMFSLQERVELISQLYQDNPKIKVVSSLGATIDLAIQHDCKAIVRGLRSLSDFEYEIQLSQINKQLSDNKINTISLFADNNYEHISSSMVKEILELGKDISGYVHPIIQNAMKEKMT